MAKRRTSKFEKLMNKVMAEPAFGKRLYQNPHAALREVGIKPTDAIVGALRDANGAPEKVHRAMYELASSKPA